LLFALVLADEEVQLKKEKAGEVLIGKNIWTLAYANDQTIVIKGRRGQDKRNE